MSPHQVAEADVLEEEAREAARLLAADESNIRMIRDEQVARRARALLAQAVGQTKGLKTKEVNMLVQCVSHGNFDSHVYQYYGRDNAENVARLFGVVL